VLGCGGCVAADGVAVPGGGLRAEPAADLLLGFRWSRVAFGLVVRRRDGGVGQEVQHVGFAVAEAFQQQPAWGLLVVRAGEAADLGQPGEDAVAEQLEVFCDGVVWHGAQPPVAGQVCLVDESAQGAGDLAGPDGVRAGLGGVLQVTKQMNIMPISA